MNACKFIGDGERVVARGNGEWREGCCDALRDRRARERMRQSLEFRIAFKSDVRSFVGGDERENLCPVIFIARCGCFRGDEMRFREAR